MLKAVIWNHKLYILGPNTVIETTEKGIEIENDFGTHFLGFHLYPVIWKRIQKERRFTELLPMVVTKLFIQFLNQKNLAVLDLGGSIIQTKIEEPPAPHQEAPVIPDQAKLNELVIQKERVELAEEVEVEEG